MKNFGKMTIDLMTVKAPGSLVGISEEGDLLYGPGQDVVVKIYRDKNGVDMVDAVKKNPHPFYIVVTDDGTIISMTDDIEQSQIDKLDIIGIDEDYGYSFGPGGTVYGRKWNGKAIVEPEPGPTIIAASTFWKRLSDKEAEKLEAALSEQPFRMQQMFRTAQTFRSDAEQWSVLRKLLTDQLGKERVGKLLEAEQ